MNRTLIKNYINAGSIKVVANLDLAANKIKYTGITQHREITEITGDEEMSRAFLITKPVGKTG